MRLFPSSPPAQLHDDLIVGIAISSDISKITPLNLATLFI
ncbi:hypothetical protein BTN49_2877 [Candidatus Enterovibrio escicola]|uniref:Uncharacterized protein n=1 Tax=Candidatus Enterovibrio escicola TaxID=1927127 RepID=A0A2A5SZQ1_9GAMM|nr:hypothetical protein BTN49_2877 [Candidatus Enterovibrio escacola]